MRCEPACHRRWPAPWRFMMTSDDSDRDALVQLVFEARPAAPPGLDARVLAIARARSRRRALAMAAASAVLAGAIVLVVLRPAPPERESSRSRVPAVAEQTPPAPAPAPAPAAPAAVDWTNTPALLEQLATPHRAELRGCFAAPGDHHFTFTVRQRAADAPASDPRDPVVRVAGHRVWNAEDACLD